MDVATACGFPHFGRFSIEYRQRYNETPSQTLKRQATFSNAVASQLQMFSHSADRPGVTIGPIETAVGHATDNACLIKILTYCRARA